MSRKQCWEPAHPETICLEDCLFYHAMDIPGVGEIKGVWVLRGKFDDYVGHAALAGQTFLDVGTASGFLTFEAEPAEDDEEAKARWVAQNLMRPDTRGIILPRPLGELH